ncbi:MAG: GTPase HflX [Chlamydiales bacterium]|nr:GTPase HflX [Chlamydiales bacterium]
MRDPIEQQRDESGNKKPGTRALLVTAPKHTVAKEVAIDHIEELELLVETYGIPTVAKVVCPLRKFVAATLLTSGKLEEVKQKGIEAEADLIIFDDEITPGQQRNLEKFFNLPVMDRTEVILEVFAQRAHSKEARLQVELARIKYQLPRLKRLWTHLGRQTGTGGAGGVGGGGGAGAYLKGEGEKQIEIDRRIIKKRIDKLQDDLKEVNAHRETVRAARMRSSIPICALVGYTNAGKSTLMNALTEAGVFVEDKLFATLDTTTRKFVMANHQEVLLIDTVGFIRKLPHHLVAAFRSTLEESVYADILLHVVDASNHAAAEQADTTVQVLKELGAGKKPMITIINKVDVPGSSGMAARIRTLYPRTVQVSAIEKRGFEDLEELIVEELQRQRKVVNLRIPQSEYSVVTEVMRVGHVLEKDYADNDVLLKVELTSEWADRLQKYRDNTQE